jgi:hypothetical protein
LKKSAKPVLFYSIAGIFLIGGIILVNVMTKLNCDRFKKDIILGQEVLAAKKNTQVKLQAELQNWCSEENILDAAKNLGLDKMKDKAIEMEVSKTKIDEVEKIMSENNE